MDLIQQYSQELIDGVDGATVKDRLRYAFADGTHDQPRTLASLHAMMTQVREEVVARGIRSAEYNPTALLALSHAEPDITAFLSAPLNVQVAIQRSHASKPSWSPEAECELGQLQILPKSMNTFKLTSAESLEFKQKQEVAQLEKNESVIVVPEGRQLVKVVLSMLEAAHPSQSYASLVLPLAIVTGRRMSELLNGQSSFAPASEHGSTYALFSGQLKKKGQSKPYVIPLICNYFTLVKGFNALREKQAESSSYSETPAVTLTNRQIKTRYQKSLHRALHQRKAVVPHLPTDIKEHDLRSIYAALVWHIYSCPDTFARTAMKILGHTSLKESLSYNNVRIEGADELRVVLGPLEI